MDKRGVIDVKPKWYMFNLSDLSNKFNTDLKQGLTSIQAKRRLNEHGCNELLEEEKESVWSIFMHQFEDFMVIVLMITTLISALLGEVVDAVAILAIIVMNAILGFIQEYRAEKSLDTLKELTAPTAEVIRNNRHIIIEANSIVPGDIVVLEAGDRVPADARLIKASSLYVDESALTGESVPVAKNTTIIETDDLALGDLVNMVFMGTLVTRGRAEALVVGTGMDSEIGKIAGMIQQTIAIDTPLQRRLKSLGAWLVAACLVLVGLVFTVGVLRGLPIYKMFLTGVSLAVAAIPEGLPAVVTIALAIGVQRMIRCNAIIRKLPSVETLGCATVICSDKTGTLTQNKMDVHKYWINGKEISMNDPNQQQPEVDPILNQAFIIGAVCNNAQIEDENKDSLKINGDPTEAALVKSALYAGQSKLKLANDFHVVKEIPFDSERKRMTVLVNHDHALYSYVKGAPGIIIDRCTKILTLKGVKPLSLQRKREITEAVERFGAQALRVLAFAYRPIDDQDSADYTLENELIFVGFAGMMDPPRMEVKRALRQAHKAGIRTIMVTGDHKHTAYAIAKRLNLGLNHDPKVITGAEWEKLTEVQQCHAVKTIDVFTRVAPGHKLSIIKALRKNGEIVAMTGDGVNDAPAVKEADIGISMGISGTDVTKEASDMILADDNYQTIIAAIREGRSIYDNIRKFIRYLLACNVGEVLTMLIAALTGLPLPLVPIQILWMNLITDGLPAIALGVDPGDQDIMERQPRDPKENIFARRLHRKIGFTGILISVCTLAVFVFALWQNPNDILKARTLAFTTLVMAQLVFVFQCRSEYHSIFEIGVLSNLYLVAAVIFSGLMHVMIIYVPGLQMIFRTVSLSFDDWLLVLCFSAASLVIDSLVRIIKRQVKQHFSLLRVR